MKAYSLQQSGERARLVLLAGVPPDQRWRIELKGPGLDVAHAGPDGFARRADCVAACVGVPGGPWNHPVVACLDVIPATPTSTGIRKQIVVPVMTRFNTHNLLLLSYKANGQVVTGKASACYRRRCLQKEFCCEAARLHS